MSYLRSGIWDSLAFWNTRRSWRERLERKEGIMDASGFVGRGEVE